jgi:hypothetical protein
MANPGRAASCRPTSAPRTVARPLAAASSRYRYLAAEISSHSLRVAFITGTREVGVALEHVQDAPGNADLITPAGRGRTSPWTATRPTWSPWLAAQPES